jgi:hypothetical protein
MLVEPVLVRGAHHTLGAALPRAAWCSRLRAPGGGAVNAGKWKWVQPNAMGSAARKPTRRRFRPDCAKRKGPSPRPATAATPAV